MYRLAPASSSATRKSQRHLVDSHCHLDDQQFDNDRDAVIERARKAGIKYMLAIGTGEGPPDLKQQSVPQILPLRFLQLSEFIPTMQRK